MFNFKSIKSLIRKKDNYRPTGYVIYIPTYRCNYRCHHCNLKFPINNPRELAIQEISDIFKNSKILNKLHIEISGGEPFLKNDIIDIIKCLTDLGYTLGITTNGAFPKKIRELIKEIDNIDLINFAISIDCIKEIHDKIREDGAFEKAIESLKILTKNNVNVCINTTISDLNMNFVEQVKTYFNEFGVQHNFILQSMVINNYHNFDIKDVAYLLNKADVKFGLSKGQFKINDCHAGYNGCLIDPYGNIYTCLMRGAYYHSDKFIMGNLRQYNLNFDNLWTSPKADKARNSVKKCDGCYGPCEIKREIMHGDINLKLSKEDIDKLDPPKYITMGDNNSIFLEDDWYNLENWPPKIRWTGKKATVYLKNDGNCDMLSINAFSSFPIKGKILVDSKKIKIFEIQENKWSLLETILPIKNDIVEVTIEIDRTWVPNKIIKNGDTRELGVAIQKIWVDNSRASKNE